MNALVADDERLARNELRRLLGAHPDVSIVAEARNVEEAEAVLKREPSNARAHYWFGRAQLEQRGYDIAAKSFEEATTRQPSLYDAYVQQAAAYEAMGEKAKAASALSRYAEERRKNERGATNDER